MKELDLDRQLHDIKIIYRAPHAVFNDRIVFTPIKIKGDKHVKIMFDRIDFTPRLKAVELYISVKSRIEVGGEDVQQTTMKNGGAGKNFNHYMRIVIQLLPRAPQLGVIHYHVKRHQLQWRFMGSSYQQECIQSLGREDKDEDDVDHGRDEYEEMIGKADFHENNINYENVDNVCHDVMDDHDNDAIEFQDDIGDGIGVQHVTTTVLHMKLMAHHVMQTLGII